ncbi:hypothetical protein M3693_03085 [Cellulosimicrobium funkei]|uniref:hypothetical protein n=1 Tax=Cellulosimicrobium funkei TaxID=264251 RepID=UPI00203DA4D3|nr:hypothetical protein [Cellulosimicrobium funkei]MCM3533211.1 hypothetical protein [Cellulosimicrobium funkei]
MRARGWVEAAAVVLSTAVLVGCGSGGAGPADGTEEPEAASSAAPSPATDAPAQDGAPDDAATCVAFSDVMTIVENADLGLADGRMAEQERDGWYRLATRVLGRLPSGGDSDVQTAVGDLQAAAPAVAVGTFAESTGVGSPEWSQAQADLGDACEALGAPLTIAPFTGG